MQRRCKQLPVYVLFLWTVIGVLAQSKAWAQEIAEVWDWSPIESVFEDETLFNALFSAQLGDQVFILNNEGFVYGSSDLENWERAFTPVFGIVTEIESNNDILYAYCGSGVYYSADGERWDFQSLVEFNRPSSGGSGSQWLQFANEWVLIEVEDDTYRITKELPDWISIPPVPGALENNIAGAFGDRLVGSNSASSSEYYLLSEDYQWIAMALPTTGSLRSIASHQGVHYMNMTIGDKGRLYASSDLESWSEVARPADEANRPRTIERTMFAGDLTVMIMSDGTDYLSIDGGQNWSVWRDAPREDSDPELQSIEYRDGVYTALEGKPGHYGVVQSQNGVEWRSPQNLFESTIIPNGLRWTTAGYLLSGTNLGQEGWGVSVSTDFDNWVRLPSEWSFEYGFSDFAIGDRGRLIAIDNDALTIVNESGELLSRFDKPDWMTDNILGGNGAFFSVGADHKVYRSEDGDNWEEVTFPDAVLGWPDLVFHERTGRFYAGLKQPVYYSSVDGKSWLSHTHSLAGAYNVVSTMGRYILLSTDSGYAISANGVDWVESNVVGGSGITSANGRYLSREGYLSDDCMNWEPIDLPSEYGYMSLGQGWLGVAGNFPVLSFVFSANGVDWINVAGAPVFGTVKLMGEKTYILQGKNIFKFIDTNTPPFQLKTSGLEESHLAWILPAKGAGTIEVSSNLVDWEILESLEGQGWRTSGETSLLTSEALDRYFRLKVSD